MLETMGSNLSRSRSGMEREITRSIASYVAEVELGSRASNPYPVLLPQSHRLTSTLHTSRCIFGMRVE